MTTTAQTASARLDKARGAHRDALNDMANLARVDAGTRSLYDSLCKVAKAEAAMDFYDRLADLLGSGKSVTEAALVLSSKLARGADDTWSGRSNEIKRVGHDRFAELVGDLIEEARFA